MTYYLKSIHFNITRSVRWVWKAAEVSEVAGPDYFKSGWTVRIPNVIR